MPFGISVGSNSVRGFEVQNFSRVQVGSLFDFGSQIWVEKGSKFSFSVLLGPGFEPFLAEQVQSSDILEGFKVQFWWTNLGSSEFKV